MNNKAKNALAKEKYCYFCINGLREIDYKNWQQLQRFTSSYGKIVPRRRSGVCLKHQRKLSQAIKRARFLALLPFTSR
ncbi:MAG: 30S ribosomal protein S18 [Candidatus Komeilibacteria bacterium CG10_big_fil_rev_8_21_14_0_10_41_13]|uniref:Small ribosomal subunit protein bS18 n=1 Tax=Candidatus Komeilibacteria bacterium CG10_big_fil_rev_8_21_14_0_10_41_13 TaxID=1974476 RepID=A0A2M6WCI8_9BACT|nr:MAG: 30S ribosomal protein S18 [Candidatus Komeilibacteria bacterium CG10_big_fil_rev_8_21_14_0_10_41_13]